MRQKHFKTFILGMIAASVMTACTKKLDLVTYQ